MRKAIIIADVIEIIGVYTIAILSIIALCKYIFT